MKGPTCANVCKFYLIFWILSAMFMLLPPFDSEPYTITRVIKEEIFYALAIVTNFRGCWNGDWFKGENGFYEPMNNAVGEDFSTYPNKDEITRQEVFQAEDFDLEEVWTRTGGNVPFVVKNFAPKIAKYNLDYLLKTFPNEEYTFDKTTFKYKENGQPVEEIIRHNAHKYPLHEVLEGMKNGTEFYEKKYLKFSRQLSVNHKPFFDELNEELDRSGFADVVGAGTGYGHLCFLGYGEHSKTLMHIGAHPNFFLQAAGKKQWNVVAPHYTPYLKPFYTQSSSLGSQRVFYTDKLRLPMISMISEPGDLLYFPGYWWHEVINHGNDTLQFGCGIRHAYFGKYFQSLLIPPLTQPAGTFGMHLMLIPSTFSRWSGIIKEKLSGAATLTSSGDDWWNKNRKSDEPNQGDEKADL